MSSYLTSAQSNTVSKGHLSEFASSFISSKIERLKCVSHKGHIQYQYIYEPILNLDDRSAFTRASLTQIFRLLNIVSSLQ